MNGLDNFVEQGVHQTEKKTTLPNEQNDLRHSMYEANSVLKSAHEVLHNVHLEMKKERKKQQWRKVKKPLNVKAALANTSLYNREEEEDWDWKALVKSSMPLRGESSIR